MSTTFDCPQCGKRMVTEGQTTEIYMAVANKHATVDVRCFSLGSGLCQNKEVNPDPVQLPLNLEDVSCR